MDVARTGWAARHRTTLASGVALAVATTAVVVQALSAEGYKAHEADLNDGGIWVVNGDRGWSGRINKPINQLDGVVVGESPELRLDVVQDGAAVVVLNLGASRAEALDPSVLEVLDGGSVAVPPGGDVQMAGGSLATVDPESGTLWAVRYDARLGKPVMARIDRQADAVAEVGAGTALAVSQQGTVVATSAEDGTLTTIRPADDGFGEPREADLPDGAGTPTAVTTVGERIVTLDAASGVLAVADGATADVPPDSVLQQAGPAADSVLVGTGTGLLSVDLDTGETSTVASASGAPAEPVRLGACVYGAWSGGLGAVADRCGTDEADVDQLGGKATRLAFRVNRGEIVLNDALSGSVWDVQSEEPELIADWAAFAPKKKDEDEPEENESESDADRRPPQARPDTYGVRPGRTSVLHPLDNDSAPEGRILSIVSVGQPGNGARVSIGPDGQTLQVVMPDRVEEASFDYFVDDGRDQQDNATVTVSARDRGQNERPTLRSGYEPRQWRVPAGGSLSVPVLADWRDDADSDAVLLDSASAVGGEESGALARSTADGRIRFTAPPKGGLVKVQYAVTDGLGAPVRRTMAIQVQPPDVREGLPPVAEPDVVRGEVGRPIEIRPLANDLPGSDPSVPHAELAIGGRIVSPPGTSVTTDLDKGVVTVSADKAGTYFLDYDAAYGNAALSRSKIRVDVRPRPRRPADPIAMPDSLTLYGSTPGLLDVLANDLDPSGDLLVVQDAEPASQGQVDVAIVNGRWLRLAPRARLVPATQVVRYTVTNGRTSATGEVTITQREQPADNSPVTVTDRVLVRAGAAVSAPVLDNDTSPSGDRLVLGSDASQVPGELEVVPPMDYKGKPGRAFVSGRVVRFMAPREVAERETFRVPYEALGAGGESATGYLLVSVIPDGARNSAPEPPTLEGRAVAGDVVTVRLPGADVDPEGDPVAITGISSAPRLGRLVSFTANALRYQAYPGSAGTDEFSYQVVDTLGAVATAHVRVAVVPATTPQPPLAVDDVLTVQPGRTATFDPMANDHVVSGDDPRIELVQAPEGAELDEDTGLVTVPAPSSLEEPAVQLVYSLSNGIDESRATMTLRTAPDIENPPVVHDAYGEADDSARVAVDVLDGAYDPDGDAEDITVVEVYAADGTATHDEDAVSADRLDAPRVIPFRVTDGQGTSALAQVFVPARGHRLPYVRPGVLIELDAGERFRGSIADYVVDPAGGRPRLTGRQGVSASPAQLGATAEDTGSFVVRAGTGYTGPGAVLVEVTTASDGSDGSGGSDATDGTVLLSIPVQVGDDTPVLECPEPAIPISAGDEQRIDLRSYCTVFTVDPRDAAGLRYTATWAQEVRGLAVSPGGGSVFTVTAGDVASEGGRAVLSVRAGDSNTEQLSFRLARAPEPRLLPIRVDDMVAGKPRTVDLAPYLVPGVSDPSPRILRIEQISGDRAPATPAGSSLVLRPGADVEGRVEYRVVMTDVGDDDDPPASRRVEGRLGFEVRGLPGAPSEPIEWPGEHVDRIQMGWYAPRDTGGSPIRYYQLEEVRTGRTQICKQQNCYFRGLQPGKRYVFRVRAHNDTGYGPWSGESIEAVVDTRPSRVRNIRMVARDDGSITLAWDKPSVTASRIAAYSIAWPGGQLEIPGDSERQRVEGLDNNRTYVFSISAKNKVGWGEARESLPFQSLGTPAAPSNVTASDLDTGNADTTVRIAWSGTPPEGPGPTVYTVYVMSGGDDAQVVPGCSRIRVTTCDDLLEYDGTTYDYYVRAANQPAPEKPELSPPSLQATFEAVGKPAPWGSWSVTPTGANTEVLLSYTVPDSRGTDSRVDILVNGAVHKPFSSQRGSTKQRIYLPSNEQAYTVSLRVCNEKAPAGCTTSPGQLVQSYGPFADEHLNPITATVEGRRIVFQVSGSSNGNQGVLSYTINRGAEQRVQLPGNGTFSFPIEHVADDYSQQVELSAWLWDDNPLNRGTTSEGARAESGPPPPPTVELRKLRSCNDGDADQTNNCSDRGFAGCINSRCGVLSIVVTGARTNFGCTVTESTARQNIGNYRGNMTNGETDTGWVFDAGYITVTCEALGGGPNYFKIAAGLQWP